MYQIKKRSGELELFELSKIKSAIKRTFDSCNRNYQESIIETISIKSVADAETKIKDNVLNVEDIQDSVEKVLMTYGYEDVAKAYILYRKQHERVRNAKDTLLNYKKTIEGYKNKDDWRVKENSTVTYSLGGLILNNSGAMVANYWLSEIYDEEIANAHRNCEMHIHDLSFLSAYCAGWSLKQLIQEGLGGVPGKISSDPASHLSTLCNQMVNFIGILQNEWAGAQAFSSVDTYLAPFVKVDNLSYKEVKQCIQSLVFGLNTPSRWGSQAPFSNFTMDWTVPDDLAELNCIVGGKEVDFKYKDCKREMDMVNKAFMEVMMEGDANGRGFQYPIPTYSITKEFDWDPEIHNNRMLFEMTAKYGIPYFSNYVNSDMSPSDLRAMCPLHENTCVCIKDNNTILNITIKDVYNMFGEFLVDVLTPSGWCKGKPVKMPNTECFKITLENGSNVIFGKNHLQPTYENGTVTADNLKVGMLLPYISENNKDTFELYDREDSLNIEYSKIVDIEKVQYNNDLYCFEVDNNDHLFVLSNGIVTHNCRLRLDLRELRRKSGGYFGSGESTGSIGVVTINLPRLAYTSKTEEEFFIKLDNLMDIAARSLNIKRSVVSQLLEQGMYPYTKRYLGSFNNHFSTIGIVGMNECCLNADWIGHDISTKIGYEFSKRVLDHIRERLSDYQEQYGDLFNIEATPAESTSFRFAMHDKKDFPDIITAGDTTEGAPYYTNSSHLPVGYTDDIFEALDHQDDLQTKYTSGTVFHAFLGEKLPSWQAAMNLTRKIAENYKLPYFTFSPTYSICQEHGYLVGEQWKCPHCGRDTEVYSRVTGYYRAVQNFNDGKAHEFKDRKEYTNFSREFKSTQVQAEEQEVNEPEDIKLERPILFTTSTCPNCKIVKQLLAEYDFVYDLVVADQDMETARKFDINQAPTLVVQDEEGNLIKIANVSNIKKFIEEAMADIEE
jgi:ribonucleoside-triphosphate reductase